MQTRREVAQDIQMMYPSRQDANLIPVRNGSYKKLYRTHQIILRIRSGRTHIRCHDANHQYTAYSA